MEGEKERGSVQKVKRNKKKMRVLSSGFAVLFAQLFSFSEHTLGS